ncbi:Hypothetical protein Ccan_17150 [Capnocytophaga canimorsus Cc5]|uniref:Uncharacterized protein n=2 Tax=Capnocytophaga canimorsus TaxID=28188 RepID=F9YSA6_CAPCC|nr:Hypothetical protein Ccan_17150 [Capnocytophaga canimorsus Cc5]
MQKLFDVSTPCPSEVRDFYFSNFKFEIVLVNLTETKISNKKHPKN